MTGDPTPVAAPVAAPVEGRRPPAWARIRRWLRGEPLHVPSHALVVHFPAALLPTSLAFDLLDRWRPGLGLGGGATALLLLGLAGGVLAGMTGLLDWAEMLPGARRARVTRHLLVQVVALSLFSLSLALRIGSGASPAPATAIAASAAGFVVLAVGNHLGGLLVYRDGMRVRTGRR